MPLKKKPNREYTITFNCFLLQFALSAGAVEYTEVRPPPNECPVTQSAGVAEYIDCTFEEE